MKTKKMILFFTATAWAVVLLCIGCSKGASYSLLSASNTFKQTEGTVNTKVDILWVIDNSGSMETSQTNVTNNLNAFIQDFTNKNLDFKMAITTTDAYRTQYTNNHKCAQFRDGILNSSCNTVSNKTYTGIRVMDLLTAAISNVFLINASQTDTARNIYGSGDERAFQSIKWALDEPLNANFIRQDSFLAVIIVSDEDDFSHDTSVLLENYADASLHTPQSYVDYLDVLTGSTPTNRRFNVSAMAIFDEPCRLSLNNTFAGRKIGVRYGQLIDQVNTAFTTDETKGVKGSLCSTNFAQDLSNIATNIITLANRFTLERLPIASTISVVVNGVTIPNKVTNPLNNGGWLYEVSTNSVLFIGSSYIPHAGSSIQVNYDPQSYGQ